MSTVPTTMQFYMGKNTPDRQHFIIDNLRVEEDVIEKEKEIGREQALREGKPENIVDKIAEGKLGKFFKENCLMNQAYVKDPNMTITDYLNDVIAKTGEKITIKKFARFQIGES